jgi:hypothetical protein
MALLASEVMDRSRAVLNDVAKDLYTDTVLLPYLQIANDDLSDELVDNGATVPKEVSVDLILPVGSKSPVLPADFIVPIEVFEKNSGETDDYYRFMRQRDFLPNGLPGNELGVWSWREQTINTQGSTQGKSLRVRYYRLIASMAGVNSNVELAHALNYLAYHTAALAAEHIGQNRTKAIDLESQAMIKLGKLLKKEVKQNQARVFRRRPFKLNRYITYTR